jgi:acyl CoA:acetate/3-ketoacid CoA transferase alpha subunit
MEKFKLTQDFIFENNEDGETIIMGGYMSLQITIDENDLVKTIEFNTGP